MSKTHWKKLYNPNYLGSYAFEEGEEKTLTIKTVQTESVKNTDGKDEECTVIHFQSGKPFICNKTNAKAIEQALKTPYVEEWAGKSIQLHVQNVRAFGSVVPAVRVRPVAPKQDQELVRVKKQIRDALKGYKGDDREIVIQYCKDHENDLAALRNQLQNLQTGANA